MRLDRYEPVAQAGVEQTTSSSAISGAPPDWPPGCSSSPTPAKPITTASTSRGAICSPPRRRSSSTQSGTHATSSAARFDGTSCSAVATVATAPIISEPTSAQLSASGRVIRTGVRRSASTPSISVPASRKRLPVETSGGIVSTSTRNARYVEPQTM